MAVGTLERRGLRMNMVDQKDRLGTLIIASILQIGPVAGFALE
jgi:hypothetical protein